MDINYKRWNMNFGVLFSVRYVNEDAGNKSYLINKYILYQITDFKRPSK